MRIIFLFFLAALAIVGPARIAMLNVAQTYDSDVAAAVQKARTDFAAISPGRAKVLARYKVLERDRKNDRPVLTWSPTDCEKEALALMYRMEELAVARVPRPGLLGKNKQPLPADASETMSTLTLSLDCIRELDPQRLPPVPPLPPLLPENPTVPMPPKLPAPSKPQKLPPLPKEYEGWMSAGKADTADNMPPAPWPAQTDRDQQGKFSDRVRP